jgi:hypothetical protein
MLDDADSKLSRLFAGELPGLDRWRTDLRKRLPKADPVRPTWSPDLGAVPWGTLGLAIDARIRLALSDISAAQVLVHGPASFAVDAFLTDGAEPDDPVYDLVTLEVVVGLRQAPADVQKRRRALGLVFRQLLGDAVDLCQLHQPGQQDGLLLDLDAERQLCQLLFVAGWLEEVARTGRVFPGSALDQLVTAGADTPHAVLALVPEAAVDDLIAMLVRARDIGELVSLRDRRPFCPGPTFAGSRLVGGADADLIAGTLLVDIKATVDPRRAKREDLQQLVGYTLLDLDDRYGLDEVGFFYARHGVLVLWQLPELLVLIGASEPLDVLRGLVAAALGD